MNRLILLVVITVIATRHHCHAQLLLSQDQSYTFSFLDTDLRYFGDGFGSPNTRGFATFYTDTAQSSAGATYRLELFEDDTSPVPIAVINGSGNLTANAVNGWQDLAGVARVTVTSGDVFFDALRVGVYSPDGLGTYHFHTTELVPVPEPGAVSLMAIGTVGLLGWTLRRRRR